MDPALQILIEGRATDEIEVIARLRKPDIVPEKFRVITQFDTIVTGRINRRDIYNIWADNRIVSLKAPRSINLARHYETPKIVKPINEELQEIKFPEASFNKQVAVGIADWGFDFTHPNFKNEDGTTRFLSIWNQSAQYDGHNRYGYGSIYTKSQINKALKSKFPFKKLNYHPAIADSGTGSHGTHVLDIAAGNGTIGNQGNAPNAALVAVHLGTSKVSETLSLGDQGRLLESVHFMHHIAKKTPLVINLSVGSHGDAHRGLTLVEQAFDKFLLQNNGRAIVQSVGNYFKARAHASGRLISGDEDWLTWKITPNDYTDNELEIWYSGKDKFRVELYNENNRKAYSSPNKNAIIYNDDGEKIGKIYHRINEPNTGLNHIDIFLYKNAKPLQWKVRLYGEQVVDGRYHSWIERDGSIQTQSRFTKEDVETKTTLGTICNGFYTIAVGAFDDQNPQKKLASFSSSGPTSDGRVKPDIVAPGVNVIAAKSATKHEAYSDGKLTSKSGTSMASPFVTGAIAILFQEMSVPLTIHQTRKFLFSSLDKPINTDNNDRVGNGYINIQQLINNIESITHKKIRAMRPQSNTNDAFSYNSNVNASNNILETYNNRVQKYMPYYLSIINNETIDNAETIPSSGLSWPGATPDQINFMKSVYDFHVRRSSRGRTFVNDVPANRLGTVEGRYKLQTQAVVPAQQMLQALRQAISTSRANVNVQLTSAYRSASHQFSLWNRYFITRYYSETRTHRQSLSGGEHGREAIQYLARYIGGRVGAPGFSNHNRGLAIDIGNTENGRSYRNSTRPVHTTAWQTTWIWRWLTANAASYNFYQNANITEPWHWEYRTSNSRDSTNENLVLTPELKEQWINEKKLEKTFLANETANNICLLPIPVWFNATNFQNNFIGRHGAVANEMLGNPATPVTADYFVIHDTAGSNEISRTFASRKGIHLWLNIGNVIQARDWGQRGSGVKIERGNNGCFVHTELTRHPQLDAAVAGVKDAGTYYTNRQYELLAYAYVICSIRKGRLLEVTIHREVDRSVEYHTRSGATTYGHGDPKHFNINTFYNLVNQLLQMPNTNYTFGIQHSRVIAQGENNRAGYTNAFIPFVENRTARANQYGTISHRTNSRGNRIPGNYVVNNIRVRRRC
jgi:subtilisin family serine protease|nr:S8 family serine peptidase [uncultured Psychroserpens sp.]